MSCRRTGKFVRKSDDENDDSDDDIKHTIYRIDRKMWTQYVEFFTLEECVRISCYGRTNSVGVEFGFVFFEKKKKRFPDLDLVVHI